jgi:hypothetical protein
VEYDTLLPLGCCMYTGRSLTNRSFRSLVVRLVHCLVLCYSCSTWSAWWSAAPPSPSACIVHRVCAAGWTLLGTECSWLRAPAGLLVGSACDAQQVAWPVRVAHPSSTCVSTWYGCSSCWYGVVCYCAPRSTCLVPTQRSRVLAHALRHDEYKHWLLQSFICSW